MKYPLSEGLNNYQRPLPPYFTGNIYAEQERKGKIPARCCFVCSKLPVLKANRLSFRCEDCGKALCISSCFKIYHTQLDLDLDYKLNSKNFRGGGLAV